MDDTDEVFTIDNSGYVLRSYHEVWKDQIRAAAAPNEVTRLPKMQIGAAMGVFEIVGKRHEEAAEYMLDRLADGLRLPRIMSLVQFVEEEFEVAVSIDYGPGKPEICRN